MVFSFAPSRRILSHLSETLKSMATSFKSLISDVIMPLNGSSTYGFLIKSISVIISSTPSTVRNWVLAKFAKKDGTILSISSSRFFFISSISSSSLPIMRIIIIITASFADRLVAFIPDSIAVLVMIWDSTTLCNCLRLSSLGL